MGFWAWVFVSCVAWLALGGLCGLVLWWGSRRAPVESPCDALLREWSR